MMMMAGVHLLLLLLLLRQGQDCHDAQRLEQQQTSLGAAGALLGLCHLLLVLLLVLLLEPWAQPDHTCLAG
jgi:hypothetical protein